ncbi:MULTISPECIES: hemolysin family protein [Aestuariimicrobium]|uniref:hemolysin family protein n=1 Tax=Aestuariimicrobium TaxID=396388 RepID=UPI0003B50575|nr:MULTISPECIES: hemolysin family protein [Aestuariimicrobium]CAI9411249.1 hypothetical protein AESSP_02610 [Aestuariimicrobium sp. T2.26MG-19.2B]
MGTTDWVMLGFALASAILASILVATDAALQSFSRSRSDQLVEDGRPGSARLQRIVVDPAPYVNASMFVRILAEIVSIVLVAFVVYGQLEPTWQRILIAAGSMVVTSFIFWGVAPRTIGRQRADQVALAMSGPVTFLDAILGPIPQLMILIGNALTPGRGFADGPFSSEAELREMVDLAQANEVIEAGQVKMIHSVFELGATYVKEVMVPRTDVVWVSADKTLRQGQALCLRSGISRIPVVGAGGLDDVQGILFLKDATRRIFDHPDAGRHETVAQVMRPVTFVPDSKPVDEVLRDMQRTRTHLVMVVDEFGGTAGLLSIEDILEEIVGEIVDEYDADPTLAEEIGDGTWRISARMPIDDLGDLFGLHLDDDDVETVGGLMAKQLSVVPIPGSMIVYEGLVITAEKEVGRRHQIDTCLVRRAEDDEPTEENAHA